jgi:hypothetical protein
MNLAIHDPDIGVARKAGVVAVSAGSAIAMWWLYGAVSELQLGLGREKDKDTGEPESWAAWNARKTLLAPTKTIPLVGGLAENAVVALREGSAGLRKTSPLQSPLESFIKQSCEWIASLAEIGGDKEDAAERAIWSTLAQLGTFAGLGGSGAAPLLSRQSLRVAKYGYGLATGKQDPQNPADVVGGLVYGSGKQHSNPASELSDLVEGR